MFVLQFMEADASQGQPVDNALSEEEARTELTKNGWNEFEFFKFGDEDLNFGRFPTEKFSPSAAFSFCVCKKI